MDNSGSTERTDRILELILEERERQRAQWDRPHEWGEGDCSSTTLDEGVKLAVLLEEAGEVARAYLEGDKAGLARELVQVAAVAAAWREALL